VEPFYMVACDGRGGPTKKHDSFDAAVVEADRLSQQTKGAVYVLQSVAKIAPKLQPVELTLIGSTVRA
jgi:hypothetical protein